MKKEQTYLQYHAYLLEGFYSDSVNWLKQLSGENGLIEAELVEKLTDQLERLLEDSRAESGGEALGVKALCTIVGHLPQLTPVLPRDLFWYYGEDCLHYLSNEEISEFQKREDEFFANNQHEVDFRAYLSARSKNKVIPVDSFHNRQ